MDLMILSIVIVFILGLVFIVHGIVEGNPFAIIGGVLILCIWSVFLDCVLKIDKYEKTISEYRMIMVENNVADYNSKGEFELIIKEED